MKKLLIPVVAIFAIVSIVACSKNSNSPEGVITKFLNAVNNRKWDEAKQYATKESVSMIDMVKGFADMMPDTATAVKFTVVKDKVKVDGDNAEVTVKDENNSEMAYKLKKVDGAWKVDFTMEALMGDMNVDETMNNAMDTVGTMMDTTMNQMDTSMHNMK